MPSVYCDSLGIHRALFHCRDIKGSATKVDSWTFQANTHNFPGISMGPSQAVLAVTRERDKDRIRKHK